MLIGRDNMIVKKREILPQIFCIFTCIYYTLKGWKYSTRVLEILLIVALISAFFNTLEFIRKKYNEVLLIIPILILSFYKMTLNRDTRLIVALFAILVGMNVSFDRIATWILKTKSIVFSFAYIIGGYVHLNYLAMNIGVILLLALYIYYPRNHFKALLAGSAIYIFGIIVSKSGSMLICGGIGLGLYCILNKKLTKKFLTGKYMCLLFPAVLFVNWLLAGLYALYGYLNSNFNIIKVIVPEMYSANALALINKLNLFLSGRINLAAFSMSRFGFSLWGGNIDYNVDTGLPYFLVDSGIILLLQEWGLIISAVIMALFVLLMHRLVKAQNYGLIISAIIIILWAFNEDTLMSIGTNCLFFAIGSEMGYSKKPTHRYLKFSK